MTLYECYVSISQLFVWDLWNWFMGKSNSINLLVKMDTRKGIGNEQNKFFRKHPFKNSNVSLNFLQRQNIKFTLVSV